MTNKYLPYQPSNRAQIQSKLWHTWAVISHHSMATFTRLNVKPVP